jgi:hypothetical protein
MAGNPTHGREGVLYLSTTSGSTELGTEIGWTNSWSWTPSKDQTEINALNQTSKYYVEGLIAGAVSAEGSLVSGSEQQRLLIGKFARVINDTGDSPTDTEALAPTDGNLYLHLVAKPIDTAGSSDDAKGQKIVVPVLASGFSVEASGGDIVGWSYDGTQNGDATYIESTSTAYGIPTKAV